MNLQEELELPPWEKYIRYGYFPYKLVLHVSIVAVVTALVVITNLTFAGYSRSIWASTVNILFPQDYTDYQSDLNSPYQYYIYTQNQTIADANRLLGAYFDLPQLSVNDITIYDGNNSIANPEIVVWLASGTTTYAVTSPDDTSGFPLTAGAVTPEQRQFFNDLRRMDFRFFFESQGQGRGRRLCFRWELLVSYDLLGAGSGQLLVTGRPFARSQCDGNEPYRQSATVYGLCAALLALGLCYQLLLLKAVGRQMVILNAMATARHHRNSSSCISRASLDLGGGSSRLSLATLGDAVRALTWRDRFRVVNLWVLVSSLGNAFGLFCAGRVALGMADLYSAGYLRACLGAAALFHWFALSQYLEYFPRYYVMLAMLKITVPRVGQFLLGVLPLFVGYALLGLVCFGDVSDRFGDMTETLRTLFAIVNGDVIYDNFNAIDYFTGVGGQAYLYAYVLLFTYVVLMTIIAIVEEAFFAAQASKGVGKGLHGMDEDEDEELPAYSSEDEGKDGDGTASPSAAALPASASAPLSRVSTSNTSTLGKRDLPEHLRSLLQNVDRAELLRKASSSNASNVLQQPQSVKDAHGNAPP